ncbi:methyltransferase, partial [Streptococcus mutans]|nr:methyltransferase [Streptococcus mutans]
PEYVMSIPGITWTNILISSGAVFFFTFIVMIIMNRHIRKIDMHTIIEGSINHLKENGSLTIVIQKKQGAPSAKAKMENVFGNAIVLKRDKGYYVLRSVKEGD